MIAGTGEQSVKMQRDVIDQLDILIDRAELVGLRQVLNKVKCDILAFEKTVAEHFVRTQRNPEADETDRKQNDILADKSTLKQFGTLVQDQLGDVIRIPVGETDDCGFWIVQRMAVLAADCGNQNQPAQRSQTGYRQVVADKHLLQRPDDQLDPLLDLRVKLIEPAIFLRLGQRQGGG